MLMICLTLGGCAGITDSTSADSPSSDTADATSMGVAADTVDYDDAISQNQRKKLQSPANQVYYFPFDNSKVQAADTASIDAQANYLIKHSKARIRLEGHTDERGSREYNIALGWRRAKAVSRLMEQLGVEPKQLILISYGEEKPAALGANPAALQRNRRVKLVYEVR
jgi:peptidoglycan-associated lipoprotein